MAQAAVRNGWNVRDALLRGALFVVLLVATVRAFAIGATLAWDPVDSPALAGYVLHYGPSAGNYTSQIDVGNTTSRTVSNLAEGATYHFAVTAYDASHTETGFSNDVSATIPYGAPSAGFAASVSNCALSVAVSPAGWTRPALPWSRCAPEASETSGTQPIAMAS